MEGRCITNRTGFMDVCNAQLVTRPMRKLVQIQYELLRKEHGCLRLLKFE